MTTCAVPKGLADEKFEDVYEAMQTDKYWINFFVRPCCPPPGMETAIKQLDKRREEVRAHADYTDDQKTQLLAIIDERQDWYAQSPFAHK